MKDQGDSALKLRQGSYFSKSLHREQHYAYFLPEPAQSASADAATEYPMLILLHGRDGSYLDWANQTRIASFAANAGLVIAFPDGGNGWYTNAVDGSAAYEDDLIQDFVRECRNALPVLPPGRHWGIGGLSMGGYGAVKLALKHTDLFSLATSHSGSMEKPAIPDYHPVFGDPVEHLRQRRAENLFNLAEQALSRWPLARPRLYLDCGLSDEHLAGNRRFHGHLDFLGYHHVYREMPGHHTWPYWNRALRSLLPEIARILSPVESQASAFPQD